MGIEVGTPRACERVDIIISFQIASIRSELEKIDERLAQLGDSDEDRVEELLLRAAKRLLLRDLHELSGFTGGMCLEPGASGAVSGTIVEA